MVSFYPDEIERIMDAELMMMGIQPSELERMSPQQRFDLYELWRIRQQLARGQSLT